MSGGVEGPREGGGGVERPSKEASPAFFSYEFLRSTHDLLLVIRICTHHPPHSEVKEFPLLL